MNKDFDIIASQILGKCYANMTEPYLVDYGMISFELFETLDRDKEARHITGWLLREAFIRQIGKNNKNHPFISVELTLKGRKLIESSDQKAELEKAIKMGSIQVIATIIGGMLSS
jgi:hypothetical protein